MPITQKLFIDDELFGTTLLITQHDDGTVFISTGKTNGAATGTVQLDRNKLDLLRLFLSSPDTVQ